MSDFLPCPFCGDTEISVKQADTFRWRVAICETCGARSGEVRVQTLGDGDPEAWEQAARLEVINEWNGAALRKDIAALRKELEETKRELLAYKVVEGDSEYTDVSVTIIKTQKIAALRELAREQHEALELCLRTYCTPVYPDETRAQADARAALARYEAAKKEGLLGPTTPREGEEETK